MINTYIVNTKYTKYMCTTDTTTSGWFIHNFGAKKIFKVYTQLVPVTIYETIRAFESKNDVYNN